MLQNKSETLSHKLGTRVRIPWKNGDTISRWDQTCIWAMEQFGLPGDKYTTHPTTDYMDFYFQNEKDAIHFSLRWL